MEVAGEARCMAGGGTGDSTAICSICYEDIHLIVEDLQAIYVCGHVFHEICLQQWFEYCSRGKHSCPVCKQRCKDNDVGRLYFQSLSESNESINPLKQTNRGQDSEEVRMKNRRLEEKVSGLSSILERRQEDVKELSSELCIWKDTVKTEVTLKNEVLQQLSIVQDIIRSKSEDLQNATTECSRLQQRNISLAKELASLKLVYDLNLEEEDVLKLASFESSGNKDTIDVLRKSLVGRNKSYKELIAKCNLLGRKESRCLKKLEKAKEKIKLLKARVQGFERDAEMKEMDTLRSVKASAKANSQNRGFSTMVNEPYNMFSTNNLSSPVVKKPESLKECFQTLPNEDPTPEKSQEGKQPPFDLAETVQKEPIIVIEDENTDDEDEDSVRDQSLPESAMDEDVRIQRKTSNDVIGIDLANSSDIPQGCDGSSPSGDRVFTGGLMYSGGVPMCLGKWCKRVQSKGPSADQGIGSSELISVGADGRGGSIKILRPVGQLPVDRKERRTSNKKSRSFPIEHFFGRVGP